MHSACPHPAPTWAARHDLAQDARERLDALARLLDSAVRVPGTNVRVGADALLNLVPGVGTLASKGVSAYLIWEARRLGVPLTTLLRMAGHVGVDLIISAIPIVGWLGDVFYRSNLRNMALLREHLDRVEHGSRRREGAVRNNPVIDESGLKGGER